MRVPLCVFYTVLLDANTVLSKPQYDDESPIRKRVDTYPDSLPEPVPFGHIGLEGIGDDFSGHKPPMDPLELDMVAPRNEEEAINMLKKGRQYIKFSRPPPKGFWSPRDMYLSEIYEPPPEDKNITNLKWYNLAELQSRNVQLPPQVRARNDKEVSKIKPARVMQPLGDIPIQNKFIRNRFQLKEDLKDPTVNWTSCDEFAVGAFFSPKEIVNIDWVPFFIWSLGNFRYATVHKFSFPTTKLVNEYREKYGNYINKTIDWKENKLFVKGMSEMLLIAKDNKGLFDVITKTDIPDSAKYSRIFLPSLTIRLKIEDPYLVMTYCEDYFATVMAIAGTEPTIYKEMKAEAASIKFVGTGGPVWRDIEAEKEKERNLRAHQLAMEEAKIIKIDNPTGLISQYD